MPSDEALLERLLQGDMGAFDALYTRYERPLFGFVRRYLSDTAEAEDVFHEAFIAMLEQARRGQPPRSFRAWLYTVARNLCLNRLRDRRRATRALAAKAREPAGPQEQPDSGLLRQEAAESLRQAVDRLPDPLGELYALRSGGLSYAELAEVLDIPLGTVKSRMNDMLKRLREEMSP
jgi:RNA polymerase sigma-70 factor (ECF subfamily)